MIFALLAFAVSLVTMLGGYWLFVVRPESQQKTSVVGRLKKYRVDTASMSIALAQERLSHIPFLEALLSRRVGLVGGLQSLLTESGLKMTVGTLVLSCFVGAAIGVVIGWQVLHLFVAALVLGLIGAAVPYLYVRYKRTKRLQLFEEQFPEAIDLISRALRAGHAFTTGLGMVADEIPAPVGAEFKRLYDEQNFGMSMPDALKALARRVPVLDARFFVTAVLTQRESGGNLSEILDNLAGVMRERFKLKRQIRVISAHGRISAWVLSCLPPALAGILFILSPGFMSVLFNDPWGVRLVLIAAALQLTGTVIISRMVRIEY